MEMSLGVCATDQPGGGPDPETGKSGYALTAPPAPAIRREPDYRVCLISSCDYGGAGVAATRLHQGLRKTGVASTLYLYENTTNPPGKAVFAPATDLGSKLRRRLRLGLDRLRTGAAMRRKDRQRHFVSGITKFGGDALAQLPECDLVNLHYYNQFFDDHAFFPRLPQRLPVVWTLHDMNGMTGGCVYTGGCDRFRKTCGR
ncbi:MAG TPA: hypothetical protein VKE74_27120, partial [Gemmataceae bacterium]|nr:hypothetical protein [Gemmataceae bacterium]